MKIPQIPLPLIPQNFPVYQDQPGIVGYKFTDPGEPPPPFDAAIRLAENSL